MKEDKTETGNLVKTKPEKPNDVSNDEFIPELTTFEILENRGDYSNVRFGGRFPNNEKKSYTEHLKEINEKVLEQVNEYIKAKGIKKDDNSYYYLEQAKDQLKNYKKYLHKDVVEDIDREIINSQIKAFNDLSDDIEQHFDGIASANRSLIKARKALMEKLPQHLKGSHMIRVYETKTTYLMSCVKCQAIGEKDETRDDDGEKITLCDSCEEELKEENYEEEEEELRKELEED